MEHRQAGLRYTVQTQTLFLVALLTPVSVLTAEIKLKASRVVLQQIGLGFRGQAVTADFVFPVWFYPLLLF